MKILTLFLLSFSFKITVGQTRIDTVNNLFHQGEIYFTTMYVNKNFDSASKLWDRNTLSEMKDFYKIENIGNFTDSLVLLKIKEDYSKYYQSLTHFELLYMAGSHIENQEPDFLAFNILYYYKETLKKRTKKKPVLLYFISRNNGETWGIQDFKIKEIAKSFNKPN